VTTVKLPSRRLPRGERREQILEASERLFARRGLAATTTRDLAMACGVSESALYKHFSSKEDLFRTVLDRKISACDVAQYLEGLPPDLGISETLEAMARKILDIGLGDPLIQKLLVAAILAESPEASRLYFSLRVPFVKHLEERLREGVRRGEVRDVNTEITARSFVGLVTDCVWACNFWDEFGHGDFERETVISNSVSVFLRGLLSDQGGRGSW
jgi:AcrR family transcriptional regulator